MYALRQGNQKNKLVLAKVRKRKVNRQGTNFYNFAELLPQVVFDTVVTTFEMKFMNQGYKEYMQESGPGPHDFLPSPYHLIAKD